MRATRREATPMWMSSSIRLPTARSVLPFMDAYAAIQKVFGDQVEIGYSIQTGLSPYILEDVAREAVRIFDGQQESPRAPASNSR
jgi:hypothetical protein